MYVVFYKYVITIHGMNLLTCQRGKVPVGQNVLTE